MHLKILTSKVILKISPCAQGLRNVFLEIQIAPLLYGNVLPQQLIKSVQEVPFRIHNSSKLFLSLIYYKNVDSTFQVCLNTSGFQKDISLTSLWVLSVTAGTFTNDIAIVLVWVNKSLSLHNGMDRNQRQKR